MENHDKIEVTLKQNKNTIEWTKFFAPYYPAYLQLTKVTIGDTLCPNDE